MPIRGGGKNEGVNEDSDRVHFLLLQCTIFARKQIE